MPNIKNGILYISPFGKCSILTHALNQEMSKTELYDLHKRSHTVIVLSTVERVMQIAWDIHDVSNSICITLKPKQQVVSNCLSNTQ